MSYDDLATRYFYQTGKSKKSKDNFALAFFTYIKSSLFWGVLAVAFSKLPIQQITYPLFHQRFTITPIISKSSIITELRQFKRIQIIIWSREFVLRRIPTPKLQKWWGHFSTFQCQLDANICPSFLLLKPSVHCCDSTWIRCYWNMYVWASSFY